VKKRGRPECIGPKLHNKTSHAAIKPDDQAGSGKGTEGSLNKKALHEFLI
jgi:hypothetical protein